MAYPKIYRERVLEYIRAGHTQEEARKVYKVSTAAIKAWRKLESETGSLEKRELNRQPSKYHPDKIKQILEETPDAYLSEIAEHFEDGTIPGVQSALSRMNITLKKKSNHTRKPAKKNERCSKKS